MKYSRIFFVALIYVLSFTTLTRASATLGTIDPNNVGHWKALMQNSALTASPTVNFGKFTTQTAHNITVSNTELRGYAWGEGIGWFVTNCADTTSGCSTTNGNFKIANDGTGALSGYAWGENTGWINFGPFSNPAVSTVKITNGLFGGTLGSAGYAWSQNYGWIKFDCSVAASCVETDWGVTTPGGGGGGSTGGGRTQCSDGIDNADPEDVLIDAADPACHIGGDLSNAYVPSFNSEIDPPLPVCSNGLDDDGDGFKDYMYDSGCKGDPLGTSESNDGPSFCDLNPGDRACIDYNPTTYACSDRNDNDGDRLVDYPDDPGCSSLLDDSEENTTPTAPFCTTHPADPSCVRTPSFCELNPSDPTCHSVIGSLCERFPTLPTCNPVGPGGGHTPLVPVDGGHNPFITLLTAVGLSLPVASAIVSFVTGNPIAFKDIPLLFGQLWSSILVALGLKSRKKPWGVVYDSITKRPIDPAYVVLMDMTGNEIATAITDMNGRYGFAVDPGTYRIVANKTNYQFPSTKLAGKESDGLYDDLYFGGDVVVAKDGEIITKNIPLDQLAFDWNEYAKQTGGTHGMKLAFYRTADIVLYHLSRVLFMLGFAYAIYAFLFSPILYNTLVLVFYVIMAFVQMFAPGFHKKGSVLSKDTKRPLPFSVVRIISAVTNKEVAHKVADRVGNYYGLVQNGLYTFVVDTKKPAEDGYDNHPVDTYVKVKKGYLKETFKV
jgi:hypothetical protein